MYPPYWGLMKVDRRFRDWADEFHGLFVDSMTMPYYVCSECLEKCEPPYMTYSTKEMREHWEREHHLPEHFEVNESCIELDFLLLSELILILERIKPKPTTYFSVSSKKLWESMKERSGDTSVPSQMPTRILNKYYLLDRKPRERKRSWRDAKGRRCYSIKIDDLKDVIEDTEYDSLKIAIHDFRSSKYDFFGHTDSANYQAPY